MSNRITDEVTRKYYKGKSFRWAGHWETGKHYFNDEYVVDYVTVGAAMCICVTPHLSSEDNKPVLKYDVEGNITGLEDTTYWQFALATPNVAVRFDETQSFSDEQKQRI